MNHTIISYLDNIDYNDFEIKYNYFDLVLSGGGFKGYYHVGLCKILKNFESKNKIKIRYIIGTSTGAISAIIYACNIDYNKWIESFYKIKENIHKTDLHRTVIEILKDELPSNAHELCNGKIKITTSKLTLFGFIEEIHDNFISKEHLISVLSASIKIPYLTSNSIFGEPLNNYYHYDGFFTRVSPIQYNNDIPQLLVKTYIANYSSSLSLKPVDSHIELLSLRGLYESKKFFKYDKKNNTIEWIESNNKKKVSLYEKYSYILYPGLFYLYTFIKN